MANLYMYYSVNGNDRHTKEDQRQWFSQQHNSRRIASHTRHFLTGKAFYNLSLMNSEDDYTNNPI